MRYYLTNLTKKAQTIADVVLEPGVETPVDNTVYEFAGRMNGFKREMKREEAVASVEADGEGGPIEKGDLGTAIKPDKNK